MLALALGSRTISDGQDGIQRQLTVNAARISGSLIGIRADSRPLPMMTPGPELKRKAA